MRNRTCSRSIGDALTKFGVDVWLDESELGGGDAWDQKIRRQIRECDYFMPVVSARTEARHEGYFRRRRLDPGVPGRDRRRHDDSRANQLEGTGRGGG
jgi:hypothetical protein